MTSWTAARHASLSITNSQSLLKLTSIESVMPSNRLILCHALLLPLIFLSIRVFSKESVLPIRWPEYWSFSFSISPPNGYSGLIFFRIDWFDCQCLIKVSVNVDVVISRGFPGGSVVKNPPANADNAGDAGSIPGLGRSLWRRKWQPTRVFLPRRSHRQRTLAGYSPSVTKSHTQMSRHTISTPLPSLVISLDFLAIRFVASLWQLTLLDELFDDFDTIGLVICLCRRLGMRAGWIFIDHPHLCFPEWRGCKSLISLASLLFALHLFSLPGSSLSSLPSSLSLPHLHFSSSKDRWGRPDHTCQCRFHPSDSNLRIFTHIISTVSI